jgi:hypothetical protein
MSTIITRNSATSGSTPSSLIQGELAINVTDGKLFYGSGSGNVVKEFGTTASYALNALSASYARTSSYLNTLNQDLTFNGNLTLNGTASITYLNVSYESASVIYSSGSNQFGDASNDVQTLWGTVDVKTGPVLVTGSVNASGGFTGSLFGTASYTTQALSSSHALTASYVNPLNQTVQITGSLQVQNSIDSSLRFLLDSLGTSSLDWEDGYLYNGSGSISVDWRDKKLYDSNVDNSVNWNSRQLFKSDGTTVTLNWETGAFTGSMLGTSSYAAQALSSSYALSASYATTASFASTASFINVTGSNVFVQNGNSFGTTALLGTNDNNSLAFETNATTRMFVSSSGIVGVRTTTPEYTFDVSGSIRANGSFVFATDGAGGNGLFFQRNSNNNWTWGSLSPGIGNVMTIVGNTMGLPQVVTTSGGLNVTPGGNQTSYALGVTVGAYPSATLATFSSGSVIALTISGSGMRGTGSFSYLGNITATSFTGSLLGTASYATQALSSSYALTASYVQNAQTASYVLQAVSASYATTASYVLQAVSASYATQALSSSFATTASYIQTAQTASYVLNAVSASYAITASYVQIAQTASYVLNAVSASYALTASYVNPLRQTVQITGSLDVAGTTRISGSFNTAASGSILTVIGSGSAQPIFTVQGSQGELFSITDSLSGSLFSVNDISGLPILEVFSDNTTLIGNYQDPMLITTAKVVQTNSGSFTVYSLPTASYDTAFFEYSVKSGSNARAGTIMAIQSGSAVNFTETTTTDFGSTSAVSFTVIVTGSNMALTGSSTSGTWTIKTIVRGI